MPKNSLKDRPFWLRNQKQPGKSMRQKQDDRSTKQHGPVRTVDPLAQFAVPGRPAIESARAATDEPDKGKNLGHQQPKSKNGTARQQKGKKQPVESNKKGRRR